MQSEAIWIPELRLVQRQRQLSQSASRIPLFAIGCRLPPLKRLQKTQTRNQPACGFGFYLVNSIMSRYLASVHVHTPTERRTIHPTAAASLTYGSVSVTRQADLRILHLNSPVSA